jgi:peptidoglycan hydrolase-like protein with peptidoglycan-binding domain
MTARLWRAQAACGQLMRRCASGSRAEKEWFAAREAILCPGWFGWKGRSYALPTVGRSSARSWATLLVQQAIWTHGPGRVALDGRFGPRTRAALKGWQASVGQRADGVISGSDWLRVRWGACGD